MLYRTLGKTGEKVSVPGYGCMRLPVIGIDYGKVDDKAALKLVRYAVDNGADYIDTSWPYHSLDPFMILQRFWRKCLAIMILSFTKTSLTTGIQTSRPECQACDAHIVLDLA